MKKISPVLISLFLFLPVISFCQATWVATSSDISFKIKNAGFTVTGRVGGLKTQMVFSPDKLSSSSLKGTVEVATLKTGIDKRDRDLQEEKYFNTDKYKLIEIVSTKLYARGAQYAGLFNITIKGVTKQMEIPFGFTRNEKEGEFKADFTINRKDFGVGGGGIMGDEVKVSMDVKASQK